MNKEFIIMEWPEGGEGWEECEDTLLEKFSEADVFKKIIELKKQYPSSAFKTVEYEYELPENYEGNTGQTQEERREMMAGLQRLK